MKNNIDAIPINERPRERLHKYGPSALADYELLAIILRTGTKEKSVLDLAREITVIFEPLFSLSEAPIEEIMLIKGIGKAKAIELAAAIELGRRIVEPNIVGKKITSPSMIYQVMRNSLQNLQQENVVCLFLNTQSQIIAKKTLSIGTLEYTVFHPRDVLKWALKYSAYAIVLIHNHPSGNAFPSQMDKNMTWLVNDACEAVGLKMIDHIIIGINSFYSFAEAGIIKGKKKNAN